ncbi:MAG: MmcQ/YjbR family DNA-binding protein [Kineosporiaceae bacterium]
MAHPLMFDDDDPLLARVRGIALALPDAAEKISHGHPAFYTAKVFAYYGGSIRQDGEWVAYRHSVVVLADDEERPALLEDPQCYRPAYLGPSGWVGLQLSERDTDWHEVAELIETSYRLTAGPRRVARLDAAP